MISIDAELAWGFHDQPDRPTERIERARSAWVRLLGYLDRFEVPATWAVVGHLFLDECDGRHGNHPAPTEWFARDPGGTEVSHRRWYGSALIDHIRSAGVDHEIGCHSFSHVIFDPGQIGTDVAAAEFETCVEIAATHDISLRSFVYPRNVVGFRAQLAEHGFRCYRTRTPSRWYDDAPLYPLAKLAGYTVGDAPPVVTPRVDEHGLVELPASLDLFSLETPVTSALELIAEDPVVRQAKLGIDAAADTDGVFHLWLHPNNLTRAADFERLRAVLSHVARRRRDGAITVATMDEVARRTLDGEYAG
ncbi:polysaccharide deacetylase family protein [Halorientalis sp. IM1011]|uniref:polysaccharide deacetylase family protein n=1 Tax=Halorientalis sp. IM1011 TaxID=1932360 RepID=UPI0020A29BAD|nr:polysaccharide deacetylase family protein [Halorientalis sp. IM1011]